MESLILGETPATDADNNHQLKSDSAENFQTFIYELFEQNGIINDLRAYLRGHIVNVLKNAQTGIMLNNTFYYVNSPSRCLLILF